MISLNQIDRGPAFRAYSRLVVVVAVVLVWWGAATTTKQAGMVFADWPLSLGSFNPPGWLDNVIPFLEHSHRLLAKLAGTLVLGLFAWSYVRSGKQALEVLALVVFLAVVLGFFIAAGNERTDAAVKSRWLGLGLLLAAFPVAWLVWSWRCRGWDLVQKLSGLALLMVVTQAILGGLRVTEISNAFAVAHGCFAQCFFCVLILIVMAAGHGWHSAGFASAPVPVTKTRIAGIALVGIVLMQLVFGASMRHFHRHALPDDGLLLTQGRWIPSFEDPMIAMLFLHKFTALTLLLFIIGMCLSLGKPGAGTPARHALAILGLILFQILLGLTVIGTDKSFWVTTIHVLNGLLILAASFVFAVRAVKSAAAGSALAKPAVRA